MTKEEVIEVNKILDYAKEVNSVAYKVLKEVLEQEPFMNKPCVAHQVCHEDKVKALDKIRAEIKSHELDPNDTDQFGTGVNFGIGYALGIIDKYKAKMHEDGDYYLLDE